MTSTSGTKTSTMSDLGWLFVGICFGLILVVIIFVIIPIGHFNGRH